VMIECGASVECVHLEADLRDAPLPGPLRATGAGGSPRDLMVTAWSRDQFTLRLRPGGSVTFVRAPVTFRETAPPAENVAFLGAFSRTRVERNYVYLVQMWLWQSDDRWLAYYVRANAMCGSTNDFVHAAAFEGKPREGTVDFNAADRDQRVETFHIALPPSGSDRIEAEIVYGGRPLETIVLSKGSVLRSPIYESAPLGNLDAARDWLSVVSMGYFLSWKADCARQPPAGGGRE
jgi:hypothetical protein